MAWNGSRKTPARQPSTAIDTMLGKDASFEGTLHTSGNVCVEGTFKGTIESAGRVILNQGGRIEGDVTAAYVSVHGAVQGKVVASVQLDIGEAGSVRGEVRAGAITVAKGGLLDGTSRMLASEGADAGREQDAAEDEDTSAPVPFPVRQKLG